MKLSKMTGFLLGMLAVAALLAAACGGDDAKSTPTTGAGTQASSTAAATPKTQESNPSATLKFAYATNGGSNYDPHTAPNPFVNTFLYLAYDRLINLTPDGKFEPQLAESWEFKDNGKTLELKLRKGVEFHDAAPFNANAVKANIERAKTNAKSTLKADLTVVDSVVVLDDYTVQLKLNAPASSLPALLADRAGMMISPTALANTDLDLKPVGAGPFKVVSHDPGKMIAYEKFDKYWNPKDQRVARIEISMVLDPATRLRALRSGEIDSTSLNLDQLSEAEKAGLVVTTEPYTGAFILYLNMARSQFANLKVRQAMAQAIDRKGINDGLQAGKCPPTAQVFPAGYWANDPGVKGDLYKFDPTAAKKLLADAGFPSGFSFSTVVINVPFYSTQAEAIQAQLAQIGVKMDLQIIEPAQLLAKFAIEKSVDSYFSTTGGFIDPAKTVAQLYLPNSTLNPGAYANSKIVELAAKGLESTEQAQRQTFYQQLSKVAAEDVFHIPVCSGQSVTGSTNKVQNLRPNLAGAYDLRYASMAK
jgi:peptide/nickel transport system substrate-binding protein